MQTATQTPTTDLKQIASEIFKVLTEKEQSVITQRFDLDGQGKKTLDNIGQKYAVTRERIRQIESVALTKLRRTMKNTQIKPIVQIAHDILIANGGLLIESALISKILTEIGQASEVDGNFIRVALTVDNDTHQIFDRMRLRRCWAENDISKQLALKVGDIIVSCLKKEKDAMTIDKLTATAKAVLTQKKIDASPELIQSTIAIDTRLASLDGKVGLVEWRHIKPRALRDKAFIVLQRHGQPLHFTEITNAIIEAHFDQKPVRTPAVHNELIRSEKFVLVGRGLYALRSWGRQGGIVPEVLGRIVKNAKSPLTKQEIIDLAQKEREVKTGTIVLNLQKHPNIVSNGNGTYSWKD